MMVAAACTTRSRTTRMPSGHCRPFCHGLSAIIVNIDYPLALGCPFPVQLKGYTLA
jgi:acetyl esterase/lipase